MVTPRMIKSELTTLLGHEEFEDLVGMRDGVRLHRRIVEDKNVLMIFLHI